MTGWCLTAFQHVTLLSREKHLMTLEFKNVSKFVDGQIHIHPTDLTLEKGTMNVLLGPTLSGKTSLTYFYL